MSRRREGEPGGGQPVQPERARARDSDPDAVTAHERGEAGEAARGSGINAERGQAATMGMATGDPGGPEGGHRASTTGWVEESATRLLEAFHDLAGGTPVEEVALGEGGASERRGAAQEAGMDLDSVRGSVERDVAVRYLLNNGYVHKAAETGPATYKISPSGIERVRRMRGLPVQESPGEPERSGMSDKMQTRLLSILTIVLFIGLNGRVKKFIDEQIPERRGVRDDLLEAGLQGVARMAAVFAAAVVVRRLAGSRR